MGGVSRHTPAPGFFVSKDDVVPIGVILPSPVRRAMMLFAAASPTLLPLPFAGPFRFAHCVVVVAVEVPNAMRCIGRIPHWK